MLIYCFLGTNQILINRIVDDIKNLNISLREIARVYGEYDIVLKIAMNSSSQFNDILAKFRKMEGVDSVEYLFVNDKTKEHNVLAR